jgi:hypothetical protein
MEEMFRGHNIRKDTYQSLVDYYADFAAIYKDLNTAAGHAKGKTETFKELFLENLYDLLSYQVPSQRERHFPHRRTQTLCQPWCADENRHVPIRCHWGTDWPRPLPLGMKVWAAPSSDPSR